MSTWMYFSPRSERALLTGMRAFQQKRESAKRNMADGERRKLALRVARTVLIQHWNRVIPHAQSEFIAKTWARSRRLPTHAEMAEAEEADIAHGVGIPAFTGIRRSDEEV